MANGLVSLAMAAGVLGVTLAAQSALPPALAALVETERAFANTTAEVGVREGFLRFFADDSLTFQPELGSARAQLQQRPVPASPPPMRLVWEPRYGDVAAAGDIGYLTGPFSVVERATGEARQYGCFFSIWERQADGAYRVKIDQGIQTTDEVIFPRDGFTPAPDAAVSHAPAGATREAARDDLIEADRRFAAAASRLTAAYASWLAGTARVYRDGQQPLTTPAAVEAYLSGVTVPTTWEPIASEASASADLGYTYGRYSQGEERGHYVRVWKRQAGGAWRIVVDVTAPAG
jgi:ketosteroid isomerase-like protein